jgi:hypothetical protein
MSNYVLNDKQVGRETQKKFLDKNLDQKNYQQDEKKLDDCFLNQQSTSMRTIKNNLKVSRRTFLLPEDQESLDSDAVIIKLSHTCVKCSHVQDFKQILEYVRHPHYFDVNSGLERVKHEFYCHNCNITINPNL